MDRNREARRVAMANSNGLPRRRHRTSNLRDSPEDEGPSELQETARFRDRPGKRDRDREKERSDRDRSERERERDRLSRSKRRRVEKYIHGSNNEEGVDDSSADSINDEEEEDPEDGPVRFMPPNPVPVSSSSSPSSALTSNRKSYPPPSKVFRVLPTWKAADEMIGFSIPRKARSASTKRSHDWSSSGVPGEQFLRQTSSSPVRPGMAASSTVASPSAAPMSPSSSSISMKKKIKANGLKHRPPKCSTQSPSSIQDDIEIEVAEVLYGLMRQSQGPSKQEMMSNDSAKYDSREVNRSAGDSKSRVSSPISNSAAISVQDSSAMPQTCAPSASLPLSAVATKRKRPRLVGQPEEHPASFASRSSPISTTPKIPPDLQAKQEVNSQNPDKNSDTPPEIGGASCDLVQSHGPESIRETVRSDPASAVLSSEEKRLPVADQSEGKDTVVRGKLEEVPSPKKELVEERVVDTSFQRVTSAAADGEKESHREEKFEIDLMAPPPQSRSPERQGDMDHPLDNMATFVDTEIKTEEGKGVVEDGRTIAGVNTDLNTEVVEKGSSSVVAGVKEGETQKTNLTKSRNIDHHLDLDRSAASRSARDQKLNQQLQKQMPQPESKTSRDDDISTDKTAQPNSLPMSMPLPAGWPAGLPPMGYVAPLQGMVPMDGRAMAPSAIQPPHFLFTQPRPGRCATHCYIAKNISSHQQFMKNYSFWPPAAGAAPLFSAKPYNLNLIPAADLHGSAAARSDVNNPVQDKGQTFAFFPGQQPVVKDKGPQPATIAAVDVAQKKQLYHSFPPGGPNSMLHGPATLFFPMGQQAAAAAAAAASNHGKATKSPVPAGISTSASMSTPGNHSSAATGQASPATMSFSYPNMPANDTQYLAILANGAYQFPVPTHVSAAQAYRGGAHPQVMPFFSGSYYPSQMMQSSQGQQQQQHQQLPPCQPVQIQSSHQNPNVSTASSSSQKHSQNQQQRQQGSSTNGVNASPGLQAFPIPKSRASQTQQLEMGGESSPSTADSRVSRPPNMNVYGQNFALPFCPSNFALMTSPSASGATANNGGHPEKKQQPQSQQQALAPQAFAMSFASMNGATPPPGLDLSSMEQNHAIFQSLPEAARNNYHIMAAAAAAQAAQQKNFHGPDDGKSGGQVSSHTDGERNGPAAKASSLTGQSIALSRSDMVETSATAVSGNNVVDSSARSLNLVPGGSTRSSRSSATNIISNSSGQQQLIQLQKQQQFAINAAQNKAPVTSNGNVYSDHLSASSAKFPNALSGFPPSMVQGTSPAQSQWRNSGRTMTSQVSSPSMSTSNITPMKNFGQQGRSQPGHTQISFGGNAKSSNASQGQQVPNVTQSPSPPVMIGSPSTSAVSKGHSGSPRMTTSSSMGGNKPAQASSLSNKQGKNSPSVASRKSSPVTGSGRNLSSSPFGNSHMPVSSSGGSSKSQQLQPQSLQQLQQPQLSKQSIQQAQMFFSNAYMQTHPNTTSSATSSIGSFQLQRHRPDQQQQSMPKSQGGSTTTSSSGMLSLSQAPANPATNGQGKAVAAAVQGGILHAAEFAAAQASSGAAHTLASAGFSYVHAIPPAAVQVKQAEQKQPAGNDNLRTCWQPEKK